MEELNKNESIQVLASRCKSKKAAVLTFINLGLAILFIVIFVISIVISKGFTEGKDPNMLKVLSFILLGAGIIIGLYSIFTITYLVKHNKNLGACLEYDNNKKVFIVKTVFNKTVEFPVQAYINIKVDYLVDGKLIIYYRKSNGKKDRIALGWSVDYKKALDAINEIRDQH